MILCLPDDAAKEAAALVAPDNDRTVLIDASTAHRVNPAWAYGFPELSAEQRKSIAKSKRISNPGCYATGYIALTAPLKHAGLLKRPRGHGRPQGQPGQRLGGLAAGGGGLACRHGRVIALETHSL